MDSIRVSEAPDPGSIPGEATTLKTGFTLSNLHIAFYFSNNKYSIHPEVNKLKLSE